MIETQPPKQNHNPPPQDKSKIICYKCGRFGHYKRDCKMKEKINNLNMNYELKEQIAKIFLESSDEEEIGEIIEDSDEEIEECGETDCDENCSCRYQVNVISRETKRALEMINLIENPEEKLKWLTRIKSKILEEKEENRNQEKFKGYDFNKILQRAKQEERKITKRRKKEEARKNKTQRKSKKERRMKKKKKQERRITNRKK